MIEQKIFSKITVSLIVILGFSNNIFSQINERVLHKSVGPDNGTLLIGGGGMTEDLWRIFLEYAGNDTTRLIIIPTSWDDNSINYDTTFSTIINQ